jgi:hypothetical protein
MKLAPIVLFTLLGLAPLTARSDEAQPKYERRWLWVMSNLMVNAEADRVVGLIERGAKDGYNGLVLADYKMNLLDQVQPNYFPNAKRVLEAAKEANIEVIPSIIPIGYSNGLLMHDTNLAEGMPVVNAPFVVKGREARLSHDPSLNFSAGDMETSRGDAILGFGYQDEPGKASFADREIKHSGKTSLRIESSPGNVRLIQGIKIRPHASYRLSAWIKTQRWTTPGNFRLMAIGAGDKGKQLSFHEGGLESTQEWKLSEVVFNSQDFDGATIYAGIYGGGSGKLWIDDLRIEEVGLLNVLRRGGCPLVVTSDDGKTTYEEGRDFEPVSDSKLGQIPYAGEYDFQHDAPPITLTARSRIRDGDHLRVSWYHPVATLSNQIMCCVSEPKVYELLRDQVRRVNAVYKPKTVMMSHDEIRVMNWCGLCRSRKLTPGQMLADNVKRCAAIVNSEIPGAEALVWSDMFDPFHNAVDDYYLVNGTLKGSWEGLAPEVGIMNWNGGKAKESLRFFADRGHKQVIAGFYDVSNLSGFTNWDAARKGVPRVDGFMYTTWGQNYGLMGEYGKAIK